MKCLVTGAGGFLGSHVVLALSKDSRVSQIIGVGRSPFPPAHFQTGDESRRTWKRCDLRYSHDVSGLIRSYEPDVIFHFAGNPKVKEDAFDPIGITRDNVVVTHNLLAHCPLGARFVLASSATVYGDQPWESSEHDVLRPSSVYGATKVAAEALVSTYHRTGRINGLILRLVANVGVGATHGVLPDLLRKLRSDAETLEVLGSAPGSKKPYVYASDTAAAATYLGLKDDISGACNICNDGRLTSEQIAEILMEVSGIKKPIQWMGEEANWAGDNKYVSIDNELLIDSYGFRFQYPTGAAAVTQAAKELLNEYA